VPELFAMNEPGRNDAAPSQGSSNSTTVIIIDHDDDEDDLHWRTEGHEFQGQRVARRFGRKVVLGRIVRWLPEDTSADDPALFHMRHDDGDEEDLEFAEVQEAIELYSKQPEAIRSKANAAKAEAKAAAKAQAKAEAKAAKDAAKAAAKAAKMAANQAAKQAAKGKAEEFKAAEKNAQRNVRKDEAAPMPANQAADEAAKRKSEEFKAAEKVAQRKARKAEAAPMEVVQEKQQLEKKKSVGDERMRTPSSIYVQTNLPLVRNTHPQMQIDLIRRLLSENYKSLPPAARRPYEEMAAKENARFMASEAWMSSSVGTQLGKKHPRPTEVSPENHPSFVNNEMSNGQAKKPKPASTMENPQPAIPMDPRQIAAHRLQMAMRVSERAKHAAYLNQEKCWQSQPRGPHREPDGWLPLAEPTVAAEVMSVWAFATSFSNTIGLSPFDIEDLCTCLQREGQPTLLIELCMALLRTLLRSVDSLQLEVLPPASEAALLLQQLPPAELVTPTTWAEVLRSVGWLLPDFAPPQLNDECAAALQEMQRSGFASLGVTSRLALLCALCDACLQAPAIQEVLRQAETARIEMLQVHNAQRRELELRSRGIPPKEPSPAGKVYFACLAPLVRSDRAPGGTSGGAPSASLSGSAVEEFKAKRAAATANLLAAIQTRSTSELTAAIEMAENSWHEGVHAPTTTIDASGELQQIEGTPWCTEELYSARRILSEQKWVEARTTAMRKSRLDLLRKQVDMQAEQPVHAAEVLGMDKRQRRYLIFAQDPTRVWVEATRTKETWRWGFYATASRLRQLVASLDGRGRAGDGHVGEAHLKRVLTERLPLLVERMLEGDEQAVTTSTPSAPGEEVQVDAGEATMEEWLVSGHSFIGRRVARTFGKEQTVLGRITRWVPPDGTENALFHAVHDDGDEEDLEEDEASDAINTYEALSPCKIKDSCAQQPKYDNKLAKKSLRAIGANLGLPAVLADVTSFYETFLHPALKRASLSWARKHGGSEQWLGRVKRCNSADGLGKLLVLLEEQIHKLQVVDEGSERKPWLPSGHAAIGRSVRRFFAADKGPPIISDGVIVGWLPPDGVDEALWHMVHADGDEEDLDEMEMEFALANYLQGRTNYCDEELALIAKANADEPRVSRELSALQDDVGSMRDVGSQPVLEAVRRGDRLWLSLEARTRWKAVLTPEFSDRSVSIEGVALAFAALRDHSLLFYPLQDNKKSQRPDVRAFGKLRPWYHASAFQERRVQTLGRPRRSK